MQQPPHSSFERSVYRSLLGQLEPANRVVPTLVGLAFLAFLLEGFSLYLFLPLLTVFSSPNDLAMVPGFLREVVSSLPGHWRVAALTGVLVLGVGLKNLLAYWNGLQFARIEADVGHRLRTELYAGILQAHPGHLDTEPNGRTANALLTETWRFSDALRALYTLITDLCAITVYLGVLLFLSWQSTLLFIPSFAAIGWVLLYTTKAARQHGAGAVAASTDYAARAWEGLAGMRTVRIFGSGGQEELRLARASLDIRKHMFNSQRLGALIPATFETLAVAVIGMWVVMLAGTGQSIGGLAAFLVVVYRMQPRVRSLFSARATLMELGNSILEVERVRDECKATALPDGNKSFQGLKAAIRFESVTASYLDQSEPAVQNLSFEIKHRNTVAFVGPSGAGKSTVIGLLCRLLDAEKGRVLVDGVDLRELRLADWYARLGVVSQDVFLFDASIADNIAYGTPGASREQVVAASRMAGAHEFVEQLRTGYDTFVGDRGIRLSGGQRQRIALARALMRKPDILIMDEATNALDGHSEAVIQTSLDQLQHQITVIIVAHRLSTVRRADAIFVMKDGSICESGDFTSLMRSQGDFASLAKLQDLSETHELERHAQME